MADGSSDADYGTVYYRSKDSIKNLKIGVRLERVTSASVVPQAMLEQKIGTSGGTEMKEIRRQQELLSQTEEEEYTFNWQEKLFSQREFDLYKHEANCEDVIEKKYHKDVIKMNERPTKRLFSYVNHDKVTNQKENIPLMTTSPNETPTHLAEKVASVRRRRTAVSHRHQDNDMVTPKTNIVNMNPSKDSQNRNHVIVTPEQTMMIMADLSPRDSEPTEDNEYVLCTVKVDANGVITMKPNFNKNRKPYRIETDSLGKEVFQYTLGNLSPQMSNLKKKREEKMFKELYNRHAQYLASLVGQEFEMPPRSVLRLLMYGEIVSARNFEYDNLFVRYIIDAPSRDKGWTVNQSTSGLTGVTQTCMTKVDGRDNVAYFSFPFEAEMYYKRPVHEEKNHEMFLDSWPKIYFEVCSLDAWQRFRPEGYCGISIPNSPGEHNLKLECWRPIGPSVVSQLRRFFVGGSPELEDLSYTRIPTGFQGSRMSRYGFRTESSGTITVKLNLLFQSQSFCYSATKKREAQRGALMTQIGSAVDYAQIKTVLDAFSKAHDRMKQARENVLSDLKEFAISDKTINAPENEDSAE